MIGILSINIAFTQSQKTSKVDDDLLYRVAVKFPSNVSHKYIYNEKSKIKRVFGNGGEQAFERDLTYHYSLINATLPDKDGFHILELSVDSLDYTFKTKDTTIYFNDQRDDLRMPKIDDFKIRFVPVGLNFNFTYSPYMDVARVGGDILAEKRNYITDVKTAPSDDLLRHVWVSGLKDENLIAIFDAIKGFTPSKRVGIDSSWKKTILQEIDGCKFIDSVDFKLSKFNIQNFTITGKSHGISAINELVKLFDIPQLLELVDIENPSTEYTIKLHPRGTVNLVEVKMIADLKLKVSNEIVTQKMETTKTWTLDKMYNW